MNRETSLAVQIAELEVLRAVASGSLAAVTVATDDTRAYVLALQAHIDRLKAQLVSERRA